MKVPRLRLDQALLAQGLAPTLEKAQALIRAGEVLLDDQPVDKPATLTRPESRVRLRNTWCPYVSRGGLKLAAALDRFQVDPSGLICADLGASTGGFTDCLLQRGAAQVFAVDVGYGQLAWKLRQDPKVVVLDRTNARTLESLPTTPDLIVGDLSFISLSVILPSVRRLLSPAGQAVLLIKPQFEVPPDLLEPGGRLRNEQARLSAVEEAKIAALDCGFRVLGQFPSPVPGAKAGNVEELIHLGAPGQ